MTYIAWTTEDAMIAVRAMERGNTDIFSNMVIDDEADAMRMASREEAKLLDREYAAYLDQQNQDWWRQQDEDDAYHAANECNSVPTMGEYEF
jgi:hypothetical protein